ncbi:MAG: hypothetical protein HFJ45_03990 [Clostridia bacterium]|nr:hypothetical protein [Clostridia bacterium]
MNIKKFCCFLFIFIISIIFFENYCYSMSNAKVYLSSNKNTIQKDETISVTLYIKDNRTSAFTSYLYFDDTKLEYISGPENTNLVGNCIIYVWYDLDGGNNAKQEDLTQFEFKAKSEGITSFDIEGEFYDNKGELINTNFEGLEIQIKNEDAVILSNEVEDTIGVEDKETDNTELENNNLETLAIENILLNPVFNVNQTNYNIEVPNDVISLNILAVPENENAKVEIFNQDELQIGDNLIEIVVTSQSGNSKKVYKIDAYRRNNQEEEIFINKEKENKTKLEEIIRTQKSGNELSLNVLNLNGIDDDIYNDIEDNADKNVNNSKDFLGWGILILVSIILLIFILFGIYNKFVKKCKSKRLK